VVLSFVGLLEQTDDSRRPVADPLRGQRRRAVPTPRLPIRPDHARCDLPIATRPVRPA